MKLSPALEYLAGRGISEETARTYRLDNVVNMGPRKALKYPVLTELGEVRMRLKFMDKQKGKNMWAEKGAQPFYYLTLGVDKLKEAIRLNNNSLWIMNGDPALWTLHSYYVKRGWDAALPAPGVCFFGEGSTNHNENLIADFEAWGVETLFMPLDQDVPGYKAGLKVARRLVGSTIIGKMTPLPFDMREDGGKDFGDLWEGLSFNANEMKIRLSKCKPITITQMEEAIAPFAKTPPPPAGSAGDAPTQDESMNEAFRSAQSNNANDRPKIDFKKEKQKWIEEIIGKLGSPHKKQGRVVYWHCPVHSLMGNGDDADPSFRVEYGGEYPRPRCTCDIQARADAWDLIAQTQNIETWERREEMLYEAAGYKKPEKGNPDVRQAQPGKPPAASQTPEQREEQIRERMKRVVHTSTSALAQLQIIMKGDVSSVGNPVINPWFSLHHMGGFSHIIPAGFMAGIAGPSGGAKTQLLETGIEKQLELGIDPIVISPEWTPLSMAMRRIQRYTGWGKQPHVTMNDFYADILWQKEEKWGVPIEQRQGEPLLEGQKTAVDEAMKLMNEFPGQAYYLYESDVNQPTLYLEDLLDVIAVQLIDGRKHGRRMDSAWFDYWQILEIQKDPENESVIEYCVAKVKAHCQRFQFVPFSTSQVTKSATKSARGGQIVTAMDAQFLRSDKFNWFATIARDYKAQEGYDFRGNKKPDIPLDTARLWVDKNSTASAEKYVRMRIDFKHLKWIDEALPEPDEEEELNEKIAELQEA